VADRTGRADAHSRSTWAEHLALMLRAERDVVQQEDAHASNEVEFRRLEQLYSQLDGFNLQATLIAGFGLATLNADNLVAIADDMSKYCIYKQPLGAYVYITMTIFSVGTCVGCIGNSIHLVARSQRSANEVSVPHSTALVRKFKTYIMTAYCVAMLTFFASFLALIWMYIGTPNWVEVDGYVATGASSSHATCSTDQNSSMYGGTGNAPCDAYIANGWDVPVVETNMNRTYVTCLNPFNQTDQDLQREYGTSLAVAATMTTLTVLGLSLTGVLYVRSGFKRMEVVVLGSRLKNTGPRSEMVSRKATEGYQMRMLAESDAGQAPAAST